MTGLKSGSGDDLWGDDNSETDEGEESEAEATTDVEQSVSDETNEQTEETSQTSTAETKSEKEATSISSESSNTQPYIVRRAIQDRSVQFERNERLTFFVHDDVVDGERDLITEVESELGRSVPKFDVREAVYRAALRNREDILEELLEMGYSIEDHS